MQEIHKPHLYLKNVKKNKISIIFFTLSNRLQQNLKHNKLNVNK